MNKNDTLLKIVSNLSFYCFEDYAIAQFLLLLLKNGVNSRGRSPPQEETLQNKTRVFSCRLQEIIPLYTRECGLVGFVLSGGSC